MQYAMHNMLIIMYGHMIFHYVEHTATCMYGPATTTLHAAPLSLPSSHQTANKTQRMELHGGSLFM